MLEVINIELVMMVNQPCIVGRCLSLRMFFNGQYFTYVVARDTLLVVYDPLSFLKHIDVLIFI